MDRFRRIFIILLCFILRWPLRWIWQRLCLVIKQNKLLILTTALSHKRVVNGSIEFSLKYLICMFIFDLKLLNYRQSTLSYFSNSSFASFSFATLSWRDSIIFLRISGSSAFMKSLLSFFSRSSSLLGSSLLSFVSSKFSLSWSNLRSSIIFSSYPEDI